MVNVGKSPSPMDGMKICDWIPLECLPQTWRFPKCVVWKLGRYIPGEETDVFQ